MRASLLRAIPWVAAGAALLAFVAPGCGIGGDDLFGGTSAASRAATSGSGAASTGGDSGNGGESSGPGPGPGTQSSGPGPAPGAGGLGGAPSRGPGGAPTAPASTAEASSAMSSSSGPLPDPPLECGAVDCVLGQESCCWDANEWNGAPQGECVTGGPFTDNCNTDYVFIEAGAETRVECQLPEHCPGQVCCGHRNVYGQGQETFAYYDITTCQDFCDNDDRILCNPMGPDDCPSGSSCTPSMLLPPGYSICSFN
ncbi:MAG: hypothetical protein WKG00_11565 [Polyangiaceae bacterium]